MGIPDKLSLSSQIAKYSKEFMGFGHFAPPPSSAPIKAI